MRTLSIDKSKVTFYSDLKEDLPADHPIGDPHISVSLEFSDDFDGFLSPALISLRHEIKWCKDDLGADSVHIEDRSEHIFMHAVKSTGDVINVNPIPEYALLILDRFAKNAADYEKAFTLYQDWRNGQVEALNE